MINRKNITPEDIQNLAYADFIALVRETNRPPGGIRTIRRWIEVAHINSDNMVLEIGSNTGYTSFELARATKCQVLGIDINFPIVDQAKLLLAQDCVWVQDRIKFMVADTRTMPFPNNVFDVVICGGALSFVVERGKALDEIFRVLRDWGFICVAPLFYHTDPPSYLVDQISNILDFKLPVWGDDNWIDLFKSIDLEIYSIQKVKLRPANSEKVREFAQLLSSKSHLPNDKDVRDAIFRKAKEYFDLFNENHQYLGFLFAVLRKRKFPAEMELFSPPWEHYH